MKLLSIDCTKSPTSFLLYEGEGKKCGNLQGLGFAELGAYARWLGIYGGRDLLDAFELALINCGLIFVWPVELDGEPLHDECEAIAMQHLPQGARIVWQPKIQCVVCNGRGHFSLYQDDVCDEDLCAACDSDGWHWGDEFMTDIDGNPVDETESIH